MAHLSAQPHDDPMAERRLRDAISREGQMWDAYRLGVADGMRREPHLPERPSAHCPTCGSGEQWISPGACPDKWHTLAMREEDSDALSAAPVKAAVPQNLPPVGP